MKPEPTPVPLALRDRLPAALIVVWIVTTAGLSEATTEATDEVVLATTVTMLLVGAADWLDVAATIDAAGRGTSAIVAPRLWVDTNGADDGPHSAMLPPDTTVRRWRGDSSASDVAFFRVDGCGHTWPGNRTWVPPLFGRTSRTFDATRVIWDFLAAHRREA